MGRLGMDEAQFYSLHKLLHEEHQFLLSPQVSGGFRTSDNGEAIMLTYASQIAANSIDVGCR